MAGKGETGVRRFSQGDVRALAVICLFYLALESVGITCPILFVTGVSCAGCGMSRAWMSLLRLDFAAAFHFHPLFWLPVPMGIALLFWPKIPRRARTVLMFVVCALFLSVYIARLLSPEDEIVVWQVKNGLLYRFFSAVSGAG